MAFQVVQKVPFQLAHRGHHILNRGNRLIFQGKILAAPGKPVVVFPCLLSQGLKESGPVADQCRPHPAQPGVILRQDFQKGGIFKPVL